MEIIITFLKQYFIIFSLMVTVLYFIPVLPWYHLFFVRKKESWKYMRIQKKFPEQNQINREIKYSMLSLAIFSFFSVFLYRAIIAGNTKMYFHISDHGIIYFLISPFISLLIYDTLFYWSHRFMHIKKIFPYFHFIHHRSSNPSPFSIFAFQPGEAVLQFVFYPVMVFFIPVHPFALAFILFYSTLTNIAGHSGFEFMPEKFRNHWLFRWQNSVTNHDLHHTNVKYNFGFYFVFWDKLMKTSADKSASKNGAGLIKKSSQFLL
jgi:lathosterol oxidase